MCEQQALAVAQEDLAITQSILKEAKEKLEAVEEGIAALQAKYQECLAKRDELDSKCQLCESRLIRADKVSGAKSVKVTQHVHIHTKHTPLQITIKTHTLYDKRWSKSFGQFTRL